MPLLEVRGLHIEYASLMPARPEPGTPCIVFLHEGLGSVSMWRDFPQSVADATGCPALVYSRQGYGESTPLSAPRAVDYMHVEAQQVLPTLLRELDVRAPVLLGHSDGASIALIHAGSVEGGALGVTPLGVIAIAPHVMVEDVSVASIEQARIAYRDTDLRRKLARHHRDVDSAFRGWNDIWLHPDFRDWNIEHFLPAIACPVLAIQGEDDEYGTMDQVQRIARGARAVQMLALPGCGHSPHRDQPDAVIAAVTEFIARIGRTA